MHTGALLIAAIAAWALPAVAAEDKDAGIMDAIIEFLGVSETDVLVPKRRVADSQRADASRAFPEDEAVAAEMFRLGQALVAEIEMLREHLMVADIPVEAELPVGRGPPHLYVKGLEVMAKIGWAQQLFGSDVRSGQRLPVGEVTEADVLLIMGELLREVRGLKSLTGTEGHVEPAPASAGGKTYSMVYKQLGDASFLLDGLNGRSLTSRDVFRNLVRTSDLMKLLATRASIVLTLDLPTVMEDKAATDVERQLMLAIEEAVALQSQVGLTASATPLPSLVRASSSSNYDAVNVLFAELLRIAFHLNIRTVSEERPMPQTAASIADVYAFALLTNSNLGRLGAALAHGQ